MYKNNPNARHSGRVLVRMPHELHEKLSRLAAEQGVSLNQLAVALLSSGATWRADRDGGPATSRA